MSILCSEDYIALSILRLVELEKAVVEGAGATGLAAVLAGLLPELKGKKSVNLQANLLSNGTESRWHMKKFTLK